MTRRIVHTGDAPEAVGPYSQAVVADGWVFCSGQIGLDPGSGSLVDGGTAAQARRALDNLTAVLRAAGASWNDVVRTTIYLVDMGDFAEVNAIYAEYAGDSPPARATVAVAALPLGARVEIDAVARIPGA